ncbi:MAG: DNA mismatch repair endonuclease MutH [Chromatiales bacterium]
MSAPLHHRGARAGLRGANGPAVATPRDEAELLGRARAIAGLTLGAVAADLSCPVPQSLRRAKGWIGKLIESALGVTAGSRPEPDFADLGIEVKTVPIAPDARPAESTHVCAVSLHDASAQRWDDSLVRRKLTRVLWVPVETDMRVQLAQRRVGQAVLWSPTEEQEQQLRCDWEELMELVALGHADAVSGELGVYLQLRPKAASGRSRAAATAPDGTPTAALPLGFYLRASFTAQILAASYARPS